MPGQTERVVPDQALCQIGILLQRGDDVHMVGDGTLRAIVLAHGYGAHRPHMDEQVVGELATSGRSADANDRLVKRHVGLGVFGDDGRRVFLELRASGGQSAASRPRLPASRAMRAAMLSIAAQTVIISIDFSLRLAHDEDAATRDGADEALLLQHPQRFADRRAADAEIFTELPLVQADFAGRP